MIYRNHKINAEVERWDVHELNDDGTLGEYLGEGGGDTDNPRYSVWPLDENGEMDTCLEDELTTVAEAKAFIDEQIKRDTTFQSEEGN